MGLIAEEVMESSQVPVDSMLQSFNQLLMPRPLRLPWTSLPVVRSSPLALHLCLVSPRPAVTLRLLLRLPMCAPLATRRLPRRRFASDAPTTSVLTTSRSVMASSSPTSASAAGAALKVTVVTAARLSPYSSPTSTMSSAPATPFWLSKLATLATNGYITRLTLVSTILITSRSTPSQDVVVS